jgi:hypothetical protein
MWGNRALVKVARLGVTGLIVVAAACSDDSSSDEGSDGDEASAPTDPPIVDVASPTVSGPISGGDYGLPFNPLPARLVDEYDYVEEEYFVEGEAVAYEPAEDAVWETDGLWDAVEAETEHFTTRIIVRRPADDADFNGTVLVEWLNVTAGTDADPDFGFTHELLMREGWGYVGVSAQMGGIEGEGALQIDVPGFDPQPLKSWDPERYEALSHPGDAYSYDIFSQVAQAIRRPGDLDPLEGLDPTSLIAAGESQAAMRMTTYVNAVQPRAGIYDGFLVHSRGGTGAPLLDDADANPVPDVAHIRTDLDEPVLQFETETDLFGLGFHAARQEDTASVQTWEVAGTAHADRATVDYGIESGREWDLTTEIDFSESCGRLNEGPQGPVLRAGLSALREWVIDGTAPPRGTPLETVDSEDGSGPAIARDEHGNALGGIRTPAVDVPRATLTGDSPPGSEVLCSLFGQTVPFDDNKLQQLYPEDDHYLAAVETLIADPIDAGFLLEEDADLFKATD